MVLDLVNKLMKPVFLIACISMFITWAFNIYNVLITETTVNGITLKVVDLRLYLLNMSNAWQTTTLAFDDILPTRVWQEANFDFWNQNEFWGAIINNIAFIADWAYFPINFILWILRWISWLLRLFLALIGWNVGKDPYGNYFSTLVQILDWITANLMIPYI